MNSKLKAIIIVGVAFTFAAFTIGYFAAGSPSDSVDDGQSEKIPESEAPEDVRSSLEIAEDVQIEMSQHFEGVTTYISSTGEIAMQYKTTADSPEGLKAELHRISNRYAQIVDNESRARTLSIITGSVQAVATKPAVQAHVRGDINKEAYLKTIEITDVNRTSN